MAVAFRPLDPAADEPVVRFWLQGYLEEHVGWFLEARGRSADETQSVITRRDLVGRDWRNLVIAAGEPADQRLVAVAQLDGVPVGLVEAGLQEDSFLGTVNGVLQWVVVDPDHRGQGVSRALVDHACTWFDARGTDGAALFATAANAAAIRAYERAGFVSIDVRMIRPPGAGSGV